MAFDYEESTTLLVKMKEAYSGTLEKMVGDYSKAGIAIAGGLATATAALTSMVVKTANVGVELDKWSKITGVNTTELSKLKYMVTALGGQSEQLYDVLKETAVKMKEAQENSGGLYNNLDHLNLRVTDSTGNLRDAGVVFNEIVTALGKMENASLRTAIADEIWSDAGTELLPVLLKNKTHLQNLREEAQKYNQVISQETIEASNQFKESLKEIDTKVNSLTISIGSRFLPVYNKLLELLLNEGYAITTTNNGIGTSLAVREDLIRFIRLEEEGLRKLRVELDSGLVLDIRKRTALEGEVFRRQGVINRLQEQLDAVNKLKQAETDVETKKNEPAAVKVDQSSLLSYQAQVNEQLRVIEAQNISADEQIRQEAIDREIAQYNAAFDLEYQAIVYQNERVGASLANRNAYQARLREEDLKNQKRIEKLRIGAAQNTASFFVNILEGLNTLSQGKHKEQFEFLKLARYGEAIMNTYAGINQALASVPYPYNIAAASSVGAIGFANVASIYAQNFQGGGSSSPSSGGAPPAGTFNTTPAPTATQEPGTTQEITIIIQNPIGTEDWDKMAEEKIIPSLRRASKRNITIN